MRDDGDTVVGVVERVRLSEALTAIHRSGHGHNARVIDGARGDLAGQLRRAGLLADLGVAPAAPDTVLVIIHAPARTAPAADLLRRMGVGEVRILARGGAAIGQPTQLPRPPFSIVPAGTAAVVPAEPGPGVND